jgi:hypothetical protein
LIALLPKLLALAWLSYFASGESVVTQLAAARAGQPALHVEGALSAAAPDAPTRLSIDLHPEFGMRIADDRGGRWVVQRGRVLAGTTQPLPGWLPDLEVVALRHDSDLRAWLGTQGIEVSANELARCGDGDCYVLGTRQSLAQLWVEKRALEVRRLVLPGRGSLDLEEWRSFDRIRFPARLELSRDGATATIAVESVVPAASLISTDFSASWAQAAPVIRGR